MHLFMHVGMKKIIHVCIEYMHIHDEGIGLHDWQAIAPKSRSSGSQRANDEEAPPRSSERDGHGWQVCEGVSQRERERERERDRAGDYRFCRITSHWSKGHQAGSPRGCKTSWIRRRKPRTRPCPSCRQSCGQTAL